MQVTETLSEGLKREYTVLVSAEDLESRMASRLNEVGQNVQMPGFRPGKVPMPLLRKTYGRQVLGEVLEQTVNETTSKAISDNDLKPAMQPKIEITKFEEGADLEFKLEVELLPDFEPVDFSTISLERPVVKVDDARVDERVEQIAKQFREFDDAKASHKAKEGDTVVIDFVGKIDGTEFDGGKGEDYSLELGSGTFIPGFEDQLVGAKTGEERTVKVAFPADYGAEELKGKDAEFDVTVKGVKVPKPVEIDDAMAEKLGLENLEALKTAVREQTEREFAQLSRGKLKRDLLDKLAESHDFEVPAGMLEMEFEQIWQQVQQDLERQGQSIADLDKSEDEAKQEYRDIAERRVRLGLLLSEVGRRNNLDVTQDEVNRAIAQQASQFPGQERQVFEFYQSNPEMQAQLQAPILEDKVIDFILELAKIEEKPISLDDLIKANEEDGEEVAAG
jgi:trigger factor